MKVSEVFVYRDVEYSCTWSVVYLHGYEVEEHHTPREDRGHHCSSFLM